MKAIHVWNYGGADELVYAESQKPEVKDKEVLIKVCSSSINMGDVHMLGGKPFLLRLFTGLARPRKRSPLIDVSGVVEAIGKKVTKFQPGERVYGDLLNSRTGALAEYALGLEKYLCKVPDDTNLSEAAALSSAGCTALQGVRDIAKIKNSERVLITGASGGVGHFAVQLAIARGAHVTAVCRSESVDWLKAYGCEKVYDYKSENYLQDKESFDVFFDVAAYKDLEESLTVLKKGGRYLMVGGPVEGFLTYMLKKGRVAKRHGVQCLSFTNQPNAADLQVLMQDYVDGRIKPHISSRFTLKKSRRAFLHFMQEHSPGKVLIDVQEV